MESTRLSAVVFQGGGAFGAYEYGAFKALWDKGIHPRIVTGVSIGAVNAAVIAGCRNDNPPAALDELWHRISALPMPGIPDGLHHLLSLPYNPGMYYTNPGVFFAPWFQTSFSDTAPLAKTLNDMIDWDKLNHGPTRLAVTALNIETGKLEVFANFDQNEVNSASAGQRRLLDVRHILASGALPPELPMVELDGQHYWDGGLFDNTPLKPAFKALNGIKDTATETFLRSVYVFSLFPQRGMVPKNMLEVRSRKTSINFECKVEFDRKLYKKINRYREFAQKMDAMLPDDSPLRHDEGFMDLRSYQPVPPPIVFELTENYSLQEQALMPGTDFTRKTIEHRCQTGYRIVMDTLNKIPS
ncbi:MAG: patatin-like phospholipase family protein [Magnetococcales bacterium]|nr:patatin-like phospholipase family protein [Magnetococcales bacterium]MBF0348808.1 patatin-like phospholipase family protein [Magnetococcales bacterium]